MSAVIVRPSDPPERLREALLKAQTDAATAPGLDAARHLAALRLRDDPQAIQRQARAEWDERPR